MTKQTIHQFLEEWAPRKEVVATRSNISDNSNIAWSSCLVVVSSASGFGKAARLAPTIANRLSESFRSVVVVPTLHKGHTKDIFLRETNLSQYDVAVVVGGDGAISEAINGMLSRRDGERVALAHYPGGSVAAICGNTLGFWNVDESETNSNINSLHEICKLIGTRKLKKIDVNRIECSDGEIRYSALVLSGGNNADICRISDDYRWTYSWFGPTFRYVLGFFLALFKYGHKDSNRVLKFTIHSNKSSNSDNNDNSEDAESFKMPAFGFSLYNCGRTTSDARFNTTELDSGTLGFVAAQHYLGFLDHLKFMKSVKNISKEEQVVSNLYARNDIKSIKVEPVPVNPTSPREAATATATTARPCYLGFDGETIVGSDGNRLAVPFSATVLPKEIEIVVA
jgi:diacylglycerol kinase family enzyme